MPKPSKVPRKKPSQTRSKEMVDAIIEAAARVFSAEGFETATTNGIAARAGVSVGSLYQYFPNKISLLIAVKERHVLQLLSKAAQACREGCSMPLAGGIRHLVETVARHNSHDVTLFTLFQKELSTDAVLPLLGDLPAEFAAVKLAHDNALREMLLIHRRQITVEIEEAVRVIPAIGKGVFVAMFVDDPQQLTNGKLADELTKIMLGYLTTPPDRAPPHRNLTPARVN